VSGAAAAAAGTSEYSSHDERFAALLSINWRFSRDTTPPPRRFSYTQLSHSLAARYLIIDSNGFIDPSITARLSGLLSEGLQEGLVLEHCPELDT